MAFFPSEDFSLDPRFIELQEELRTVLFAGLSGLVVHCVSRSRHRGYNRTWRLGVLLFTE